MKTNASLLKRRREAVPRGVASAFPIFAERAENAELWDVEGKRYVDFAGGIGTLNTGHRHPQVMHAVGSQMERFTHTAFQVLGYENYVQLAERLNALAPGNEQKKTIFFTSGAEAVENAVKIARVFTGRSAVVAFSGGFHGRTMYTMGLTGKVAPYKLGFGPLPGSIYHVPFPAEFHGVTGKNSLAALHDLFKADVPPAEVAAIIIEPVQGEGGFYVAPFDFMRQLRALCDEHDILLIHDEVQSGFARTGKLFASEHAGVVPDLITVAKSIAGGLPLSGVIGRADVMDAAAPGGLGGTYGGSPLACAAGLAVLDVIESENLLERSLQLGADLRERLDEMAQGFDYPLIGDIRGLGGMVAFEFVTDLESRQPDPTAAQQVQEEALERGLIVLVCGIYSNVIRILVPLTASNAIVHEGIDILEKSMTAVANRHQTPELVQGG